jgi:dTDP-4-dehydrorhamnose reductase
MDLKKILITGGSGILGTQIILECDPVRILTPTREEMDITSLESVCSYFNNNDFDLILHCAAYTKTVDAIQQLEECVESNVIGTWNLLKNSFSKNIRFVFISTDYVFDGLSGGYATRDPINPIGNYAMSKASAELLVRMYNNSLTIRTSFIPCEFPHKGAFVDQYTTRDYVDIISPMIYKLALSDKTGISHVGTPRKSVYDLALRRKQDVKMISIEDMDFYLPPDISLIDLEDII